MLKKISTRRVSRRPAGGHFAIVASLYNRRYVDGMLRAARRHLAARGAAEVLVVRVPGAYEIPVAAAKIARTRQPSAILCLGVILRGETTHAQHIAEAVTQALTQIQLQREVPVIHEVLLFENEAQARVRCLSREHNRGAEAAETALAMAKIMDAL
jgi:6,7-dimethyl-8-ribityllumazine synthase